MSTSNINNLTTSTTTVVASIDPNCFPVSYQTKITRQYVSAPLLILAIICGLLFGLILAFLIVKFCLRNKLKQLHAKARLFHTNLTSCLPTKLKRVDILQKTIQPKLAASYERLLEPLIDQHKNDRSLVDAIDKKSILDASVEVAFQQLIDFENANQELLAQRDRLANQIVRYELKKRKLDSREKEVVDLWTEANVNRNHFINAELEGLKRVLLYAESQSEINPEELAEELKIIKLRKQYILHQNAVEDLANNLLQILPASEVIQIKESLKASFDKMEQTLAAVAEDQNDSLIEQNLARQTELNEIECQRMITDNLADIGMEAFNRIAIEGGLLPMQQQQLQRQLQKALQQLYQRQSAVVRQQIEQNEARLRHDEQERLQKQHDVHQAQIDDVFANSDSSEALLKKYKDVFERQVDEKNTLQQEIDQQIMEAAYQPYVKLFDLWPDAAKCEFDNIVRSVGIDTAQMNRLVDNYSVELQQLMRLRDNEKKQQLRNLQEILEERKKAATDEKIKAELDKSLLTSQQEQLIGRFLNTQLFLDDKERDTLLSNYLRDHQASLVSLQMTRGIQMANLKHKLAARKAKRLPNNSDLEGQAQDCLALQANEALADLDDRLLEQLSLMQIGSTRRRSIIDHKNQQIQRLEEIIAKNKSQLNSESSEDIKRLLEEHNNQMQTLQQRLEEERRRQLINLKQKLDQQRADKVKHLETKLERQEEQFLARSLKTKMSLPATIVCQQRLADRQAAERKLLERKLQAQRQKQGLNLEAMLENQLQQELTNQKQRFLTQLANISRLSPEDLADIANTSPKKINKSNEEYKENLSEDPTTPSHNDTKHGKLPAIELLNKLPPINQAPITTTQEPKKRRRRKYHQLAHNYNNDSADEPIAHD